MSGSLAIDVTGSTDGLQAAMRQGATVSEKEMARIKKAVDYATMALRDIEKAQKAAGAAAADQAKISASIDRIVPQAKAASISVGQMNNALRQTPAQLTDIVTQLAGGQSPFLIMIQQGGQMRDMFGGFGNMFRGLSQILTPARLAFGAVAAAVGTLVLAYVEGSKEQEAFNKSLRLTGNYAGQTSSTFAAMSADVAKSTHTTIGAAKEITQALISSGQFGPKLIEPTALAVSKLQQVSGESAADIIKDFARMGDGVAKWALDHNKQYHFLSASQYQYIKVLEEQGKIEQAQLEVSKALYQHLGGSAVENLGLLEKAWQGVKTVVSDTWDVMKSIGRDQTVDQKIRLLQDAISENKRRAAEAIENGKGAGMLGANYSGAAAVYTARAEAQQLELVRLQETKLREEAAGRDRAARAAYEDNLIRANAYIDKIKEETKGTSLAAKEIAKYRAEVDKLKGTRFEVSASDQKAQEAAIRKKYDPDSTRKAEEAARERQEAVRRVGLLEAEATAREKSARDAYIETKAREALGKVVDKELEKRARVAAAKQYDKQQSDAFTKSMLEHSVSIDKEVKSLQAEGDLIGATTLERQQAADAIRVQADAEKMLATFTGKSAEINQWATEQVRKLTAARAEAYSKQREFTTGAKNAMAKYNEDAANQGKYAESLVSGSLNKMEDALVKFAKTGKLQFGDLFNYMADEFLRQQARMMVSQMTGGSGGLMGLLTMAAGAFGGGASAAPSAGSSQYALTSGTGEMGLKLPGHANGLDYVPYDNYVARLHEGERVLTKQQAKVQGGTVVNVHQNYTIGAGVSRSEMLAGMAQVRETTKADILSSMAHNGLFARRA